MLFLYHETDILKSSASENYHGKRNDEDSQLIMPNKC
jgi:hypothetical protein